MRSTRLMITGRSVLLAVVLVGSGCAPQGTEAPTHEDWPMYRGDLGGTGYSPLTQITTENVADLTQGWTYSLRSGPSAAAGGGAAVAGAGDWKGVSAGIEDSAGAGSGVTRRVV